MPGDGFASPGILLALNVCVLNFDDDIAYVKHRYPITAGRPFLKSVMKEPGSFQWEDSDGGVVEQEKKAPISNKRHTKGKVEKRGCTVQQILEMRELGLSQEQIARGCGE